MASRKRSGDDGGWRHPGMTREQSVRAYGSHLALQTRGPRGGPFALFEKYGKRRKIGGPYHSVAALERAIDRYSNKCARLLSRGEDPEMGGRRSPD
jgi:hypothetical protein